MRSRRGLLQLPQHAWEHLCECVGDRLGPAWVGVGDVDRDEGIGAVGRSADGRVTRGLKGPDLASASFSAAWTAGAVGMISANDDARAAASWSVTISLPPPRAELPLTMSREEAWYSGVVSFVAATAPPTQAIVTSAMSNPAPLQYVDVIDEFHGASAWARPDGTSPAPFWEI